ncbi:MAG TPA: XdhC family protein, partial [Ktedonobacterales bacterium]
MREDILAHAQRLRAEGRAFALATVVAARQPTSGTPGARAIILPDGHLEGWVGGHCAQPAVTRQGL